MKPTSTTPSPLLLWVLLLAVFGVPLSIAGTAVAIPSIAADLGADPVPLQWVVNGFNVASAAFTLVWGTLADRIGYRITLLIGLVTMVAASILSAAATNLLMLDVARICAGIAAAAIFTSATAIMSTVYEPTARARNFGILGTVLGLGLALGPAIAGGLTSWLGWRSAFLVFAVTVALALAFSAAVPKLAPSHLPGRRLVDFSLLRNRRFLAIGLVPVVQSIGMVTMLTYLPVALSAVWGLDPGLAGTLMLVMTVPILIAPAIAVRAVSRFARVSVMRILAIALGAILLGDIGLLLVGPALPIGWIFVPMILLGIGFGLPLGLIDAEALGSVPAHSTGTAAGVFNFLRIGSEAVAIAVYAAVLAALIRLAAGDIAGADAVAAGQHGHPELYAGSFRLVQGGIIILVVIGLIVIALLHRSHTRAERTREGELPCPR